MKKISLSFLAAFFSILQVFAQNSKETTPASNYEDRKLKVEEINLVSSYYHQNGVHSAVTGGVGSELLTDISNTFDLQLSKKDKKNRIHRFGVDAGFDYYTSASSDQIDQYTTTSPSYDDHRFYPSVFWSVNNPKTGNTFGASVSTSKEWDYKSYGAGLSFAKSFNENNTEFSAKANIFLDKWMMILPVELRPDDYPSGTRSSLPDFKAKNLINPRNTFNLALSLSQIVNERLQVALIAEPNLQKGQLATPYQRVYFSTPDSARVEKLPNQRWKVPIGFRANYFLGDNVVVRSFYRYFFDQWGLKAHSLELEVPIKVNPFLSISPNCRFYTQNGIGYFAAKDVHRLTDKYYTSDYDLSKSHSTALGIGVRWKPLNGVLGIKHWSKAEIRYLHYQNSNSLSSNIVSLLVSFK
jgi:Protein of unknown function (DUF3570)